MPYQAGAEQLHIIYRLSEEGFARARLLCVMGGKAMTGPH